MKNKVKKHISSIILILISIQLVGCLNDKPETNIIKKYGSWKTSNDSLDIDLDINKFKSFDQLKNRIDQIVCNDSIPNVVLRKKNQTKKIYLRNPCWKNFGCILIREKNVIEIYNDSIIKKGRYYPKDSLEFILNRDYFNNGRNPEFCDNTKKLLIKVSTDSLRVKELSQTLDILTDIYQKISDSTDIKIMVDTHFKLIPPPLPPSEEIKVFENEMRGLIE